MKIGIIGAGNVGSALGRQWAAAGHEVKFGVRDANKPEVAALIGSGAISAGTVKDAAQFADVIVLTVPWPAAQSAIKDAGELTGKVLVDCTNPLKPDLTGLTIGHSTSAGEQVARWAKGAQVVKCFNTTGANNMEETRYAEGPLAMFMAGDDEGAKSTVKQLGEDIGFAMFDAGQLEMARVLEPVAMLWIYLAYKGGVGRDFGFKLIKR